MTVLTKYVEASLDDWTEGIGANTDGDLISPAQYNSETPLSARGHALIDTSSIPTDDVISSAVFHWFDHDYYAPKGAGIHRALFLETSGLELFFSEDGGSTDRWRSATISSGLFGQISRTGDTKIRFTLNPPAVGKDRRWEIRSWDGYNGVNEQCYLVITHAAATAGRSKTMILR